MKKVSVIGIRGYPANFIGTSGVEKYVAEIINEKIVQDIYFILYVRKQYQRSSQHNLRNKKIVVLPGIPHKFLESLWYSFLASCKSCVDKSEVVWFHGFGPAIFAWLPKLSGKRIVLTVHSLDWQRKKWSGFESWLFTTMVQLVKFFPEKFVSVSEIVQRKLLNNLQIMSKIAASGIEKKVIVSTRTNNHILQKYSLTNKKYLLYLGRFVPEKRIEWLLNAFKLLATDSKNLYLVIAGGSSYTDAYVLRLQRQFTHSKIIWLPYIFGEEKFSLLNTAECLVVPSELEGLPITALEMIGQTGKVVIGDECIDPDLQKLPAVYTFNTTSFSSFMREIKKVLKSKNHKNYLLPKEIRDKYSWSKTAQIYKELFTVK